MVSDMQNKWYWDQLYARLVVCRVIGAMMAAVSGMSGYCFEGPVICVVSSI